MKHVVELALTTMEASPGVLHVVIRDVAWIITSDRQDVAPATRNLINVRVVGARTTDAVVFITRWYAMGQDSKNARHGCMRARGGADATQKGGK